MTRYSREEFGGEETKEEKETDVMCWQVSFTLQWMSGEKETMRYDPRLGWYHLKRRVMDRARVCWNVDVGSPTQVVLFQKERGGGDREGGEQFVECGREGPGCRIQEGDSLYVFLRV
jgi:hypothetical protein